MERQLELFAAPAQESAVSTESETTPSAAAATQPQASQPAAKVIYPRDYQEIATGRVFDAWEESNSSLIVMATGLGKTVVAGLAARRWFAEKRPGGVLFLAHRDELIRQAAKTYRAMLPERKLEVEMAGEWASVGDGEAAIIVASKDSLRQRRRLDAYRADRFGHIVIDEAHHAVHRNKSYKIILDHFEAAKKLGLTATPDRGDELQLGQTFETVAYSYDVLEGIQDGWLVAIGQQFAHITGYDLSDVETTADGDLKESQLADVLRKDKPLHGVASAAIHFSNLANGYESRRPTIIFTSSVPHAVDVANILNWRNAKHGTGAACAIYSKAKGLPPMDPELRKSLIERFNRQELQYLVNYGVATEGFDSPLIKVVIIARPTNSRNLYAQMVGRGTRPDPAILEALSRAANAAERKALIRASRKPGALIVDLLGVSGKHKLITTADILGGRYDDRVVALVKEKLKDKPAGGNTAEQLDFMAQQLEKEQREKDKERKEQDMATRERRSRVVIQAEMQCRYVDPFDPLAVEPAREPRWCAGKRPTERMKGILKKNGVKHHEVESMSMFQASKLIDKILGRRKKGLSSFGQAKVLQKFGYDPEVSFVEASRIIDGLKANGWRRPHN